MLRRVRSSYGGNSCWRSALGLKGLPCQVAIVGVLALLGCGASTRRDSSEGETEPSDTWQTGDENSRVVVGCRQTPLSLGPVSAAIEQETGMRSRPPSPQVAWMGDDFAVGWAAPDGYRVTIT